MENIQWMMVMADGSEIKCDAIASTIFEAAKEMLESIEAGDLQIKAEDVRQIIDIPG